MSHMGMSLGCGVDRPDVGLLIADADKTWSCPHGRKRAIEEAASIAEPVATRIEADDRRDHDVGHHNLSICGRDGNVPDAALQ